MLKQTMQAEDVIRDYQNRCETAMLATVDGGRPRIRPMATLAIQGNVLWMAAFSHSSKMAQMAENPHVEICYMDAQRRHLRLAGEAELVDDQAMKEQMWQEHPALHDYFASVDNPDYRLIKITIKEALLMEDMRKGYQELEL